MLSLLLILICPLGQAAIHSPHPLHSSLSILMNPFFNFDLLYNALIVKKYSHLHGLSRAISTATSPFGTSSNRLSS